LQSWNDMAWTDVPLSRPPFLSTRGDLLPSPVSRNNATWGGGAADTAAITLQRPFRLFFHAKALLDG
jgi:hypothetical protein